MKVYRMFNYRFNPVLIENRSIYGNKCENRSQMNNRCICHFQFALFIRKWNISFCRGYQIFYEIQTSRAFRVSHHEFADQSITMRWSKEINHPDCWIIRWKTIFESAQVHLKCWRFHQSQLHRRLEWRNMKKWYKIPASEICYEMTNPSIIKIWSDHIV
jgi:hypothetical protein